jgi:hypothetical protein
VLFLVSLSEERKPGRPSVAGYLAFMPSDNLRSYAYAVLAA